MKLPDFNGILMIKRQNNRQTTFGYHNGVFRVDLFNRFIS